jgi:hypothetical protein
MILRRAAASSLLLLAPTLAWAAPPETSDRPPVQRPSASPSDPDAAAPTPDPEAEPEAEPDLGSDPAETASPEDASPIAAPASADSPVADSPTDPASASAADPEPATETAPQEDLSNLLVSDEPEATPRVRVQPDERGRVDRSERLRNYYARTYRPAHNPSRIHFAARGAFAMAGTGQETSGGGRMGFANVELGQTWNHVGYGVGAALFAGNMSFGELGVENYAPILVGGGPSLNLGRLGLFGRGYLDLSAGYNFFYAPVSSSRPEFADPPDAAPHGPKVQVDVGLLLHDSESRRFRHGLGATIGWQMLVHSLAGDYPLVNSFMVGVGYFFG